MTVPIPLTGNFHAEAVTPQIIFSQPDEISNVMSQIATLLDGISDIDATRVLLVMYRTSDTHRKHLIAMAPPRTFNSLSSNIDRSSEESAGLIKSADTAYVEFSIPKDEIGDGISIVPTLETRIGDKKYTGPITKGALVEWVQGIVALYPSIITNGRLENSGLSP